MQEIRVLKTQLSGVKRPCLKIIGVYKENINLTLYENKRKIDFELEISEKDKSFILTSTLKKRSIITLIDNETNEVVLKLRNSFIKRLSQKIVNNILNLFSEIIYEPNDFIGISFIIISGIRKQKLEIRGTTSKKDCKFYLISKNKKEKLNAEFNGNDFYIQKNIKNYRVMDLIVTHNDKKFYIAKIRNKKFKRIFKKIKNMLIDLVTEIIYEPCDFVGIQNISITGIKKPIMEIKGTIEKKEYELYLINNKNKKILLTPQKKGNDFIVTQNINVKDKYFDLIVVVNEKKFHIAKVKNKITKRIKNRLKNLTDFGYYELFYTPRFTLQNIELSGVLNPKLTIVGNKENEEDNVVFKSNNQVLEYNLTRLPDHDSFFYYINLSKKDKIINVYLNDKIILKVKNNFLYRIINKFVRIIKKIFRKIIHTLYVFYRGIRAAWVQYHFIIPPRFWKKYWIEFLNKMRNNNNKTFYNPNNIKDYNKWLEMFEIDEQIQSFNYNPLISILIPVYNIDKKYLQECIESILSQTYQNFEICIVDDASTNNDTIETLKAYEKNKKIKIKYRKKNGHISKATNDALQMATGDFIGLVDNDDVLAKNALYEVIKSLNENRNLDFIYSDEDKLNQDGKRCYPHFKPDFSPETLMSLNYICHFAVLRKTIVEKVGAFEVGLEGAQDYDLFLKVSEVTNKIHHIPKILYHWRMVNGSTAATLDNKSYAKNIGKKCIENALKRRGLKGDVLIDSSGFYIVNYKLEKEPLISIIIPTKDFSETLNKCLESLYEKTSYKNYEVIVVNNNSVEKATFKLFNKYKKQKLNFSVIDANFEFNYSKINNIAVKKAKGEYIVLLNNDTEIITPEWLDIMVGYASLNHVGAVGPKLLYPDSTIQHGGVILGLVGVASHAYIGSPRKSLGEYGRLRVPYNYSAVTAACLMVKKSKYEEVNGLEEKLKVAYNDMDFNIKLLEKNYYNVFLPQVELFHYESKSRGMDTTSEKYKRFIQERDFMYEKWDKYIKDDKMYNKNFSKKGWFVLDKKAKGDLK